MGGTRVGERGLQLHARTLDPPLSVGKQLDSLLPYSLGSVRFSTGFLFLFILIVVLYYNAFYCLIRGRSWTNMEEVKTINYMTNTP